MPVMGDAEHAAIMIQHEQPDGGRQIAVPTLRIDRCNEIREGHVATPGDLFQSFPESIFQTDARLVTSDDDRALDNRRFQRSRPFSIFSRSGSRRVFSERAWSRERSALLIP